MKTWKKIVALALAAVMAMALLTACGGGSGGSKSFEAQVEDAVFAAYSKTLGDRQNLKTNDPALKKLAEKSLGYLKNGRFSYSDLEGCMTVTVNAKDTNKATLSFAMPCPDPDGYTTEYSYKALVVTPEMLGNLKKNLDEFDTMDDILVDLEEQGASLDAIGVAAKTIDGKTYFAVAMAITGDLDLFEDDFAL